MDADFTATLHAGFRSRANNGTRSYGLRAHRLVYTMSHVHSVLALSMSRRDMDDISTPRFTLETGRSGRSPADFEPDEDDAAPEAGGAAKPGLLIARYRKQGMSKLYEDDEAVDELGPLPKLMNERLAKVERELAAYEERRLGVGKAFAFISRLEHEISSVSVLDSERARAAYVQEAALSEHREARKAAEQRALDMETFVLDLKGKVHSYQKRVFILEKQHDLEVAAYVEGFQRLAAVMKAEATRIDGLLFQLGQRLSKFTGSVKVRLAEEAERRRLAAAAADEESDSFMSPEEYLQSEPLSQKGIRSYLILHDTLLAIQAKLAKQDKAMAQQSVDHVVQLSCVQRKLREVTEENHALKEQLRRLSGQPSLK